MKEDLQKLRAIADYQFGFGAGSILFPEGIRIEYSRNTKRPRHIFLEDILLANYRPTDAMFTITIAGAERLNRLPGFMSFVVVIDDVKEFYKFARSIYEKVKNEIE